MRTLKIITAAAGLLALAGSGAATAGAWTAGNASGNAGTNVNVQLSFAGDGVTITSQVTMSVVAPLSVVSATGANGQSCAATGNSINVVLFSFGALPGAATNYCDVVLAIAPGTPASPPTLPVSMGSQICAVSGGGNAPVCTVAPGAVTVNGGVVNTPPTITYAPIPTTTINYTGAGTASPIVATPGGGAGAGAAATTTVGACTITGGGAAFPTTNIAQLSFVGATVTPQNINLPNCVPQAGAATNATLTCPEQQGAAAAVSRTWPLVCPQAAVANVPPTLTYSPATGTTTNVASVGNFNVAVGCPTENAACNGSGAGLAATSRLVSVTAAYTGPPFSPTPSMTCSFVNQAGTNVAAPLDFVATQADPGNVRCTCPITFVAEPFTVTVAEQIPAGSASVNRTFNVVCGAGTTCGTISATPASGSVTLNNGGAAVNVTNIALAGASPGVNQNVNCVVSGASAGSTFSVTGVPATLSSGNTSTQVAATCNNSGTAAGTATLTCTSTSNSPGCGLLNSTYTLTCPGVVVPPVSTVPVPAMSEQGRILLAALVLLLGLGMVGFRMRG